MGISGSWVVGVQRKNALNNGIPGSGLFPPLCAFAYVGKSRGGIRGFDFVFASTPRARSTALSGGGEGNASKGIFEVRRQLEEGLLRTIMGELKPGFKLKSIIAMKLSTEHSSFQSS
jgi:hypothetical protein